MVSNFLTSAITKSAVKEMQSGCWLNLITAQEVEEERCQRGWTLTIGLFVNLKKSNRVNYQATISEDENKVARALLNTVCATKYSYICGPCLCPEVGWRGDGEHIMEVWFSVWRVNTITFRATSLKQLDNCTATRDRCYVTGWCWPYSVVCRITLCQFMAIQF